jgi:hypothetical protein
MLRRGAAWKKRNMKLLTGISVDQIEKELAK